MPYTKSKKKTASAVHVSSIVEPAAVEPEEANVSEVEAAAEATGSDVNLSILSALSKMTDNLTKSLDAKVDTVLITPSRKHKGPRFFFQLQITIFAWSTTISHRQTAKYTAHNYKTIFAYDKNNTESKHICTTTRQTLAYLAGCT